MENNLKVLALLIYLFISTIYLGKAQDKVLWDSNAEITKASFQSALPNLAKDNLQQYSFACSFDFAFQMANIQFAFTKNFNKYIEAYYVPNLSWIEEGELTEQLLLMANLDFDLVELYARKFRKRLFEAKNVGSNVNFFSHIHNQINTEFNNEQAVIQSNLNAQDDVKIYLKAKIKEVNIEIENLHEFCKTCKVKKKKKKKKKR